MSIAFKELKERVAFLQRNLVRSQLATDEQVGEIDKRFRGVRSKDKLWEHWAELRALVLAQGKRHVATGSVQEFPQDALDAAVAALSDETQEVYLKSVGETFTIYPASFRRIAMVEEHAWWVARLDAARSILIADTNKAEDHEASPPSCETCGRPMESGKVDDLLKRIQEEAEHQRGMLYANVIAPGPRPVSEPVDWSGMVTFLEEALLMQAYHRVNYDVITRLPQPTSKAGDRTLPQSWAFLFAHQADRERRPAVEIMRDRSLASTVAVIVLQAIRDQKLHAKGKADASELEEAIS